MPKFKPYHSPSILLARQSSIFRKLRQFYYAYNPFDDILSSHGHDPRNRLTTYFLGGFNPLIPTYKDIKDIATPYKSRFYVYRDFLQPARGLGNILKGTFNLVVSPLLLLTATVQSIDTARRHKNIGMFSYYMKLNAVKTAGGLLDGVTSLTRGVIQIVTTPVTWLIKMPVRAIITKNKGIPTISASLKAQVDKIKNLITKDNKTLDDAAIIDSGMSAIYRKLLKAEKRKQKIDISKERIETEFKSYLAFKFLKEQQSSYNTMPVLQRIDVSASADLNITYEVRDEQSNRTQALKFLSLFNNNKDRIPTIRRHDTADQELLGLLENGYDNNGYEM